MKLIDKDALVAELEKRKKIHFNDYDFIGNNYPADYGVCNALTQILAFIDTLEVKEVDLEKSISDWLFEGLPNDEQEIDYIKETAKHFFELGLKTQKGE